MKIAVIPIDNRPICYDIIKDILALDKSIELFMPEIEALGDLKKPADINKLFNFLQNLKDIDYLIVCLDTLAYGGLIPSRRSEDDLEDIKKRIFDFVKPAKEKCKNILGFSSIMRISNNNINEEEKPYWDRYGKMIFDWSYNYHKNKIKTNDKIPKEILDDYIKTRKRNFEINKLYLKLAQKNFFNTLIFSKDDCAQFGLNILEANSLSKIIKENNLSNVLIKTGADEIPLSLISRALTKDKKISINPVFIEENSINLISKYEDISIKNCVLAQISLSGLGINPKGDLTMLVNNFKDEQGDFVLGDKINSTDKKINFPKTPYFIADVNNANGADRELIKQIFKQKADNLYSFCAYNTSANTIGCSILIALVKFLALKNKTYNDSAFKKLMFIRFLDDWGYQSISRIDIQKTNEELSQKEEELNKNAKLISKFLNFNPKKINYSLPWKRSFEIRIEVQ